MFQYMLYIKQREIHELRRTKEHDLCYIETVNYIVQTVNWQDTKLDKMGCE